MFNEDNDLLFSNSNNDITNNINDTGMDLPPELGEIKELSDAPIAKAPTMEVLSPMNIIPDEFDGNSILDNLSTQVDYLREKRKMEVKGKISKIPMLISVISVLIFVPLLLIIILGPVILEYL